MSRTFVDAVIAGSANPEEIDDWVEAWHGGAGRGTPLAEYLGLTRAEYKSWAELRRSEEAILGDATARRRAEGVSS